MTWYHIFHAGSLPGDKLMDAFFYLPMHGSTSYYRYVCLLDDICEILISQVRVDDEPVEEFNILLTGLDSAV
jgi:hypothetical protein